jgi:hypothetical protein
VGIKTDNMKAKIVSGTEENPTAITFICPGCHTEHLVRVGGEEPVWDWNRDLDKPSILPSFRVRLSQYHCCHSVITDGVIQFLDDCTHPMAGRRADLPNY